AAVQIRRELLDLAFRSWRADRPDPLIRRTAEIDVDELFAKPQRHLSPEEIERETARLLALCAERGVEAVLPDVATCRALLESLADACRKAGLIAAAQYLEYLDCPYD